MKNADSKGLEIELMGRAFKVACPDGGEKDLLASADFLNQRMKEVRTSGRVVGNERVALLAALDITHEFLTGRAAKGFDMAEAKRRIEIMRVAIDDALAGQEK